jgi:hypothetical protein
MINSLVLFVAAFQLLNPTTRRILVLANYFPEWCLAAIWRDRLTLQPFFDAVDRFAHAVSSL